jgi:hypothetical protein
LYLVAIGPIGQNLRLLAHDVLFFHGNRSLTSDATRFKARCAGATVRQNDNQSNAAGFSSERMLHPEV